MSTHTNDRQSTDETSNGRRSIDDTSNGRRATAPTYPDAYPVGPHLVIDKTEWVPGRNPEPHRRYDGQRGYRESFYRCIKCGEERQSKQYFPDRCEGDPSLEP